MHVHDVAHIPARARGKNTNTQTPHTTRAHTQKNPRTGTTCNAYNTRPHTRCRCLRRTLALARMCTSFGRQEVDLDGPRVLARRKHPQAVHVRGRQPRQSIHVAQAFQGNTTPSLTCRPRLRLATFPATGCAGGNGLNICGRQYMLAPRVAKVQHRG